MTVALGVSMTTRQMSRFSHLLFELYPLVYFIFVFQVFQNSVSWGFPFALCPDLLNTYLHTEDDTFKPVKPFSTEKLLTFGI